MRLRRYGAWLAVVGLMLVISACSAGTPAAQQVEEMAPPAVPSNTPVLAQQEATPTATAAQVSIPTPVVVKSALEATNPATVQLASGEPQLVEFFAFW
jgi:hypothetical protein